MATTDVFGQLALGRSQNPYFEALLKEGLNTEPIRSPWQGASRLAMALLAGLEQRDQTQQQKSASDQLANLPGLGGSDGGLAAAMVGSGGGAGPAMPGSGTMQAPQMPRIPYTPAPSAPLPTTTANIDSRGNLSQPGEPGAPTMPPSGNPSSAQADAWAAQNPATFSGMPIVSPGGKFTDTAPPQYGPATTGGAPQPTRLAQTGPQGAPQVLPPTNAGAPTPQRSPVQIDPAMAAQIKTLLANPLTRSEGLQLYSQFAKPREETRPLANPQDRARYGIQPTDTNPYQIDSKGEVKAINPQPFAVNVNQQGQSEFERTYGAGMAKEALGTIESGDKAATSLQQTQLLRGLLSGIQTGKLTPAGANLGAWAQSVGLNVPGIDPKLPANAEAAQTLINKAALTNIGQGGVPANNFSEADRKFVVNMQSNLGNRPEANAIIMDAKDRMDQLAMGKADAWARARDQGVSYEKFNSDWRRQLSTKSVFGDLIAKTDALKKETNQNPASQSGMADPLGIR